MIEKNHGAKIDSSIFGLPIPDNNSNKPITKETAIKDSKKFADKIRSEIDSEALIFLFGSAVKNTIHSNSDIDIAVVSHIFDNDIFLETAKLNIMARNINENIEVHGIHLNDWKKGDPHTLEIRKWGVVV